MSKHITVYGPSPNSEWPNSKLGVLVSDEKADQDLVTVVPGHWGPDDWMAGAKEFFWVANTAAWLLKYGAGYNLDAALYSIPLPADFELDTAPYPEPVT